MIEDDDLDVPVENLLLRRVNQLHDEIRTLKRDFIGIMIIMLSIILGMVWRIHDKMGL
ncbi:hypothetical protein N9X59_02870 [Alphaproteobacteria bacterium]|nr:hypothetical protein [Alphaproteobacteria bacterium]